MQFKIANILLSVDDFLQNNTDLLYRGACLPVEDAKDTYGFTGVLDLCTYFNALPLAKWVQYTSLENLVIHLELCGDDCDIAIVRAYNTALPHLPDAKPHFKHTTHQKTLVNMYADAAPDVAESADLVRQARTPDGWQTFDISLTLDDAILVGVRLASAGTTLVRNAYFATDVAASAIRPVRLAVATTTFNNEDYILPNIDLIRTRVLESDEPIASNFHMFVVDNGNTLDANKLSNDGVTVLANPNVGGAGGFARGMIEALGKGTTGIQKQPFTHVLLMDDDVRVSPESFVRTFNLLSLVNDTYQDAFLQGAMLKLQEPNKMFEDVSFVKQLGGYQAYKDTLDVSNFDDVIANEMQTTEGAGKSYGAWWYSCIPLSAVRERGLPLPLFIRIDDVEYGARQDTTFMALGGICVWHSHFVGRFRPSVDLYQYGRNMLIAIATSNISNEAAFMTKYWRNFQTYIRFLAYDTADLWLDALEHYLQGPAWLAAIDGAQLMKDNAAKNEQMVSLEALPEKDRALVENIHINQAWIDKDANKERPVWWRAAEALPYDRHRFPDSALRNDPGVIYYAETMSPFYETAMRNTLIAVDNTGTRFHIRRLNRARYRQLMQRAKALKAEYKARKDTVAQSYREAAPYLQSVDFWKEYLGLQ